MKGIQSQEGGEEFDEVRGHTEKVGGQDFR